MKEKSRWFYSEKVEKTKAVVLIAHGLNLRPDKMDALARYFSEKHCDVLRITLGNDPKRWEEKFEDDYDKAREHAETLQLPLYFVGYSLGALSGLHHIIKNPDHHFAKAALFAPAIQTKFFTKLSAILALFLPQGRLPSMNLPDYRDRPYTTLQEYKLMNNWQNKVEASHFNLPTIVFADPKDELVDYKKLEKFSSLQVGWRLIKLAERKSPPPKKFHHLMIDDLSLGQSEWEKILNNLADHFEL